MLCWAWKELNMSKPLVALVGRPNVGKSTFFNRISGSRIAIIEDTPGVTRDRIYADAEWLSHSFTMIDTGGIEPDSDEPLFVLMRQQAELAIDTADVILFFVDAIDGLTPADENVADLLRRSKKPVILVLNKADNKQREMNQYDFYELGFGQPICISAQQGLGLGDLLDEVVKAFPEYEAQEEDEDVIKIAVVGKPNAGKSSLVNRILNEERCIVSNIAGTTRDAIDTAFEQDGTKFVIIDTAGIRRKRSIAHNSIERFSVVRSLDAVRRCDVALIVIDAQDGITEQDVKIAGFVHEEGKASIIIVNKWDLIEKDTKTAEMFKKKIITDLAFMDYVDILFISALTGQRVVRIPDMVKEVYAHASSRISTGVLNDVLHDAMSISEPPSDNGKRFKLYYASQVSSKPPTFVLFVNDSVLLHYSYKRYLENYLRKTFELSGTPIRIILRQKEDK